MFKYKAPGAGLITPSTYKVVGPKIQLLTFSEFIILNQKTKTMGLITQSPIRHITVIFPTYLFYYLLSNVTIQHFQ